MSERACCAFADMRVTPVAPETVIYGDVADDAQLHGLLALCQDLGLRVLAVRESPGAAVAASSGPAGRTRSDGGRTPGPVPRRHPAG
jgi:hypothetical protein